MVKERYVRWLLVLPLVILMFGLTLIPLFFSIYYSVRNTNLVSLQDEYVGDYNFLFLLHNDPILFNSVYRTLLFTFGSLVVEIPLGLGIALLLNRKMIGQRVFRSLIVLPLMAAPIAVGQVWRIMYHYEFGVIPYVVKSIFGTTPNFTADPSWALFSLIVYDWWQWTPFIILVLLAGLQALPLEPYESATIYGASTVQKFRYITLPMLRKLIIFIALFRVIDLIKTYDVVMAMTMGGPGRSTELISVHLYRTAFWYWQIGYACAISLIMVYAVIVISSYSLKRLRWW
jgi:multiple sugar transport system permease protein